MEELRNFYRALQLYRAQLSGDDAHEALMRALRQGSAASEAARAALKRCTWDEAWMDAISEGLPFVERALEEQRRFIETREEIRRVDQAKRATVESVRHLAQHSNLISRVQDGEVVPEKLLIVEREDSYAIYENRFLHTLAVRMRDFVRARIAAVEALDGASGSRVSLERASDAKDGRFEARLCMDFISRGGAAEGGPSLPDFARVREIEARVDALMSAPLMRQLKGAPLVQSPVVRTNVFKKNENFRRALELFEYLECYDGPGYGLLPDGAGARLSQAARDELDEAVALAGFIARMAADDDLRARLEAEYQADNAREEEERKRMEAARERAVLERIREARAEEIRIREAEVARRDAEIARLGEEIERREARITALSAQMDAERAAARRKEAALVREAEAERARAESRYAQLQSGAERELRDAIARADAQAQKQAARMLEDARKRAAQECAQAVEAERARAEAQWAEMESRWKRRCEAIFAKLKRREAELARVREKLDRCEARLKSRRWPFGFGRRK